MDMDIDPVNNPELFDPGSRSHVVAPVVGVMMAVTTVIVAMRFYTRAFIIKSLGLDDWLALLSLVFFFALGACTLVLTHQGLGRHIGTLPQPDGMKDYLRTFWFMVLVYNLTLTAIKLCFLAQYWRVMGVGKIRIAILIVTCIVGIWSLVQILLSFFLCDPIWGFWDKGPDTKCLPLDGEWYSNAVSNVVSDLLILALPIPVLKTLNLRRNQRLMLYGVFGLGLFTCVISIIRITRLPVSADMTWDALDTQMWSIAEPCSGIICVVVPTLRPLLTKFFPRAFGSSPSEGHYKSSRHLSHGTRRGTKQFVRVADEEQQAICAGGGSDDDANNPESVELSDGASGRLGDEEAPSPSTTTRPMPYPEAVHAGPLSPDHGSSGAPARQWSPGGGSIRGAGATRP